MKAFKQKSEPETLRKTKRFHLCKGYNQTENLFFVLRMNINNCGMGCSPWFPEMQAKQLLEQSDLEFDSICSTYQYS